MEQIPKIIHQIWMNPEENGIRKPVPKEWEAWSDSIQTINNEYTYIRWDEATMMDYVKRFTEANILPGLLSTYTGYPAWIQRCDAFRYIVLYGMGGIYIDMDAYPKKGCKLDSILVYSPGMLVKPFNNHLMAFAPEHPFLLECIDRLGTVDSRTVYNSTGPDFVRDTYAVSKHKDKLVFVNENHTGLHHVSGKTWYSAQGELWMKKYGVYLSGTVALVIALVIILKIRGR
jgi:mannosyltransferase OCH1-like enzyme